MSYKELEDQSPEDEAIPCNTDSEFVSSRTNFPNPIKLRTNDQLIAGNATELTNDLPSGQWLKSDIAKNELNELASKSTSGSGCFNPIWGSTLPRTSKKGKQKVLLCHRARRSRHCGEKTRLSYKCNYPFYYIKQEEKVFYYPSKLLAAC